MVEKVIKRDGKQQAYTREKVYHAVEEAFKSCKQEMTSKFIEQLDEELAKMEESSDSTIDIEDLQDFVEKFLIKKNKFEVVDMPGMSTIAFLVEKNEETGQYKDNRHVISLIRGI